VAYTSAGGLNRAKKHFYLAPLVFIFPAPRSAIPVFILTRAANTHHSSSFAVIILTPPRVEGLCLHREIKRDSNPGPREKEGIYRENRPTQEHLVGDDLFEDTYPIREETLPKNFNRCSLIWSCAPSHGPKLAILGNHIF